MYIVYISRGKFAQDVMCFMDIKELYIFQTSIRITCL